MQQLAKKIDETKVAVRKRTAALESDQLSPAQAAQARMQGKQLENVLEEYAQAARNPELAAQRARAKVQAGRPVPGTLSIAFGAAMGWALGGLEATIGGGALGFVVGRLDSRVAVRLANNPRFARWAMGVRGQHISDAIASYVNDVHMSGGEDESTFLGALMDFGVGFGAPPCRGRCILSDYFWPRSQRRRRPLSPVRRLCQHFGGTGCGVDAAQGFYFQELSGDVALG